MRPFTLALSVAVLLAAQPTSATPTSELLLAVFTNSTAIADPGFGPLLHETFQPQDYLLGGGNNPTTNAFKTQFPDQRQAIGADSVPAVQNAATVTAPQLPFPVNLIYYDPEHWPFTPLSEQANLPASISQAADIVHGQGFRFGVTPDKAFTLATYTQINWGKVDFFDMQFQSLAANGVDLAKFSQDVHTVSQFVQNQNPNTERFVQLSFRFSDAQQMIQAIDLTKDTVNGFLIAYLPGAECPNCSLDNLTAVLTDIDTLRGGGPTPVPEPASLLLMGAGLVGLVGYQTIHAKTRGPGKIRG